MKYGKIIDGDYKFKSDDDLSDTEEIKGNLYCYGADTKAAFPQLTTVNYLYCYGADTKVAFPQLTTVDTLYCNEADTKVAFPQLTTVNYLDCRGADTKTAFPQLTTVGTLYCNGADTKVAFPQLTTVGTLYCNGADTKVAFPKLTKQNDLTVLSKIKTQLFDSFIKNDMLFADNILAQIITTKKNIYKIRILGKTEISYCIKIGESFSHGKTIREAKKDLIYKIGNRDTSKFKDWKLDKKVTLKEAIESYRVITGACEQGTKNFVNPIKTKTFYTVNEIIEATKGQYGNDLYKNFFQK